MHIGVNTLFYIPGKVGGSETYLKETLRELAGLHDGEITLFTNLDNDTELRAFLSDFSSKAKFNYNLLDFSAVNRVSRILREQLQLPARIRQSKCDVLWSPGYTACLLTTCPQVVSILDMQYKRFPADLSFVARLTTDFLVHLGVRKCRRIIAISEFSKNEIIHFTSSLPDKIDVTPLGVAPIFKSAASKDQPPPSHLLTSQHPYVLCVAGSYPHKNLPVLVNAFSNVAPKTNLYLILVGGRGLGETDLKNAIETSPFKDHIIRKSGLNKTEIADLYANANVFVLPSLYEGFGLPVVEAQIAGVPVVTTYSASIPEVAGDAAIYCDGTATSIAQAIMKVLNMSDQDRADLIARGIYNASRFTWHNCAQRTLASLKMALDRN